MSPVDPALTMKTLDMFATTSSATSLSTTRLTILNKTTQSVRTNQLLDDISNYVTIFNGVEIILVLS